uniref:Reverse transcriptase domain-containing protein n=1 Tax=Nothobranchius furzeri TaxID=105023 RepID=A0A8C6LE27_NOTFU
MKQNHDFMMFSVLLIFKHEKLNSEIITGDRLSIIHINSRSLFGKLQIIQDYFSKLENKLSVIAITETWLKNDMMDEVQIEGYELFFANRTYKRGGGVALFIRTDLKCKLVEDMTMIEDGVMEVITVEINNNTSKNILVGCVYRAPGACIKTFTERISELGDHIKNKTLLLCGDFNINIELPAGQKTNDFINSMYSLGLFPLITKPTRITAHSATIIDNIFTNKKDDVLRSGVLMADISDHLPVFAVLKNKQLIKQETSLNYKRDRSFRAWEALKKDLEMQNWEEVYVRDVNTAYKSFMKKLMKLYNNNCKLFKSSGKRVDQPWMTKGIRNACAKKNQLYRNFLKSQTRVTEDRYKKYKNKLIAIIRKRKKDYYGELLEKNKANTKATWGIINSVTNRNKTTSKVPNYFVKDNVDIYDVKEISNEFNDFFVNVGRSLMGHDTLIEDNLNTVVNNVSSIFLGKVEKEEIREIVKNCGNKRSTDCEDLDMMTVKTIIESVIDPFTYICNLSLSTGVFPDAMKIAKVVPLFKNGDKHNFTNYRPVSLLPQFSKILEKVFASRLDKFIEKNMILHNEQYGFRTQHSTTMAIMDLTEKISEAIDNREYFISVFIDLKKAFDVIDHSRLLQKLYQYGIRGVAHQWVRSYLDNRKQYVQINGITSELRNIAYGVPQGSVLGPKLFNLYINDLVNVSDKLGSVLFADDTTLFYSGSDINEVTHVINIELIKVKNWFDVNKLTLNLKKTNFILFNDKENIDVILEIDNMEIQRVKEIKFLGVMIDEALSWKSHIGYIKGKVAKAIAVLYSVKFLLNSEGLLLLYNALILPYLNYCVEIWGTAYRTYTQPLFVLQKRAMRIIDNTHSTAPSNPLFIKYKVIKFHDLVNWRILHIMYKANKGTLPKNIQHIFEKRESIYSLKGFEIFKKPRFRTRMKEMSISVNGVKLWNCLDREWKESRTLKVFSLHIKSRVLSGYDNGQLMWT